MEAPANAEIRAGSLRRLLGASMTDEAWAKHALREFLARVVCSMEREAALEMLLAQAVRKRLGL